MEESDRFVDSRGVSAVLLAGGRSSRMGFDKATLEIDGQPLWKRQTAILKGLNPAQLYISGPQDGPWNGSGIAVIEDEVPHLGPMGALVSILRKIETERVIVLAVDMPQMEAEFLERLLGEKRSVVPKMELFYEPLAAVYAQAMLPALDECLATGRRSLQDFLRNAVQRGLMMGMPVAPAEVAFFKNLNQLHQSP